MSEPLVSVLIPTFDGAAHIAHAVRSALGQTHRTLEVLVGDDGSRDGTAEIAEAAGAGDGRLQVVRHPHNLGAFENPVALLRAARGEYVKFLLHDDLLLPRCVQTLVAPMAADPAVTLATSKRGLVDAAGQRLPDQPFNAPIVRTPAVLNGIALGDALLRAGTNAIGELSTALMRRADLDAGTLWSIGGHDLTANCDFGLFLKLMARGSVFVTPEELGAFRVHDRQRSQDERIVVGGLADWPVLVREARALGFLAREDDVATAWASILTRAWALALEPLQPQARARVLEVGRVALRKLAGSGRRFEAAVAVPVLTVEGARAAIAALTTVAEHADRLVLAVAPADVDRALAVLEPALAGRKLDVDLVPCPDPRALLTVGRLAVPSGDPAAWRRGQTAAVAA